MQALSPTGISRPFDARRDGFVMGEGAGVLVLEEAERARRARRATVLGEVRGYGSTSDAHHLTAPEPERRPRRARDRAGARATPASTADDVDYVNAHGTSTPAQRRRRDARAQARAGRGRAEQIPVSSTKSAIGHLLGAAGAVEAVATVAGAARRG